MKTCYPTFSSFSGEKTEFSTQSHFSNTSKMIKDVNLLKKQLNSTQKKKYKNNFNLTHFHLSTIRSEVNKNIRYKILLNSDTKEIFNLPKFSNSRNPKLKIYSTDSSYNYKRQYFNKIESNCSMKQIKKKNLKRKKNKCINNINHISSNNKFIHNRSQTYDFLGKYEYLSNFYYNKRAESLSQFFIKSRNMFFGKYIQNVQQDEMNKINEGITTKIELFNVQIAHLKKMIFLIKAFMKDEKKYFDHLNHTLKKEREICDVLIEKRNKEFHETFLLRHQLGKIHRKFDKSFQNKFFLLCVKNGTNQIEKFNEEDRNECLKDKDALEQLSDFKLIKEKINSAISKNENISYEELEISVFGRKLFYKPMIIFKSPENFKLKLSLIESSIQLSLNQYNNTKIQLEEARKEYIKKIDQIKEDMNTDEYFKKEFINNINKLDKLKVKNKSLRNYIRTLPKSNKKTKFRYVEKKIVDIYNEIDEIFPFKKSILNDKMTIIYCLKEIELLINKLIKYKNEQKEYNIDSYMIIKKKIDKQNKIKTFEELKLKAQKAFDDKIRRALMKSTKLLFKPIKKVPESCFHIMKKKKIKKDPNEGNEIGLTYD